MPILSGAAGATRGRRYPPLAAVLDAYLSGSGVPYSAYGADVREGQVGVNRAAFLHLLVSVWLPAIPDVHVRLLTDPPRVWPISGVGRLGRVSAWPEAIPR